MPRLLRITGFVKLQIAEGRTGAAARIAGSRSTVAPKPQSLAGPAGRFPGVRKREDPASEGYARTHSLVSAPVTWLAAIVALCGCTTGGASLGPANHPVYHVLFIGNSLTYFNDLPATVAQLAAGGGDSIEVESVTRPGFALIDHVDGKSNAVEVIRSRRWDYVVLQQGPSSLPLSRDTLILATRLLDADIRAAGGRTAALMVWPARENIAAFDQVLLSYQEAARAVDGVFLPAGEAWRTAWKTDPLLALYGADGFHPSELGTFLAALVVYEGITGHDARTLPSTATAAGHQLNVSAGTVHLLQHAAHETVAGFATPHNSD